MKIENADHPSLDIVQSHGAELSGKKIILCVAGSVAAYKSIELARLLMRHGANVKCVVSDAAKKLIQPDYFQWATGNKVTTKLTGDLEHIRLADYNKSDLVVVYPATANTLGKLANGIDDTPITTVLTVALGAKIPIMMCLAMHESMYDNSAIIKNIKFLENKVSFLKPQLIEGKAKAVEPEYVLESILNRFGHSPILARKKILLVAGPTIEYIDPIRVITNQSSGKTGVLLAGELISAGANLTMIYGPGREKPPQGARVIKVETSNEIQIAIKKELKKKFDVVIMAAAISDYSVDHSQKKKIKSEKESMTLTLKKTVKIIDLIKKIQEDVVLIGFKADINVSKNTLIKEARKKINDSKADLVIANDIGSSRYKKNPDYNEVLIVSPKHVISSGWKSKEAISKIIKKEIEKLVANRKKILKNV